MRAIASALLISLTAAIAQNFPLTWSQAYGTFDQGKVRDRASYSVGFAIDNYCIYGKDDSDTVPYDERRFDIFAQVGVLDKTEFEIKYSYPTCGVLSIKHRFLNGGFSAAAKLGVGYMKGTRIGYITDYVYDFYPTLILSHPLYRSVAVYCAPKAIYSIHARDRQEHTTRKARHILQYGFGLGLAVGSDFAVMPETNWYFSDNQGMKYIVNQFGVGVNLRIR